MHLTRTALATLGILLAAPVLAQTTVPSTGTSPAPATRSNTPAPSTAAPAQASLLDINSATKEQLDALPQIGPARAEAIIKARPYRAKNELVDKGVIPQNAYDAIKDRIIARQKS